MRVVDVKNLGTSVEGILAEIEFLVSKNETLYINGIGNIDTHNKELVLNAVRFGLQLNNFPKKEKRLISEKDEIKVLESAKSGVKRADLARDFGVSLATINRILRRHNFKLQPGRPKKS